MRKRLVHFAIASAGIGTGIVMLSGVALADSTPATVSTHQTTVVDQSTTSTTVTKSNQAVSIDGKGAATSDNASPSVTSQPSAKVPSEVKPATATSNTTQSPNNMNSATVTNPADGANNSDIPHVKAATPNSAVPQLTPITIAASPFLQTRHNVVAMQIQDVNAINASSLFPLAHDAPVAPNPQAPTRSSGNLGSLGQALAATAIPVLRDWKALGLPAPITFELLSLLMAAGLAVHFVINRVYGAQSYTELLGRTNFSHGPRSDVAGAQLIFATPQFTSLTLVRPPGYRLAF